MLTLGNVSNAGFGAGKRGDSELSLFEFSEEMLILIAFTISKRLKLLFTLKTNAITINLQNKRTSDNRFKTFSSVKIATRTSLHSILFRNSIF